MARFTIKDYLPRSLYGRVFAILILPVLLLQVLLTVVLFQRHFEQVSAQLSEIAAREIAYAIDAWRADDIKPHFDIALTPREDPVPEDSWPVYDFTGATVARTLKSRIPEMKALVMENSPDASLWLEVDGRYLVASIARERLAARNPHQLLVILLFSGIVFLLIAVVFLRNQLRPIRRLAHAATEFGRGRVLPLTPAGALEVRAAATAFLDMRARIERQRQTRTLMLSGVSHDLRTPLTRLRLGLSLIDDPEAEALRADVDDMERLVNGFLDYARDASLEPATPVDLTRLIENCVESVASAHVGVPFEIIGTLPAHVSVRPLALQRAVVNLLENAMRYGTNMRLSLKVLERSFAIIVEDDGPGIPPDQREEALKPFARLDPARNQSKAVGVGLGLAIVADVARMHGGAVRLGESTLGGLKAELIIPF